MSETQAQTTVTVEFCQVVPPVYQSFVLAIPTTPASEDELGQTLLAYLQSIPPEHGLQLPRRTVSALYQHILQDRRSLWIYRSVVRFISYDRRIDDYAEQRDAHCHVAWFIVSLLQELSPDFSQHLVNDGYVECRAFPEYLQLTFPKFRFN